MACPAILTGDRFILRMIEHLDCQALTLGSYGYRSLATPGSPAMVALTALLTLFIALFGVRLLFGPDVGARDLVGDVLKIGIVLLLAMSWPAYRILAYDLVLRGPAEIASVITGPDDVAGARALGTRLQQADTAMIAFTATGAGRTTGASIAQDSPEGSFSGMAIGDDAAFGWARLAFLAGTIGSLAVLRLGAGLLLALAPIAAGFLFFEATRGLFSGWLRGLVMTMIGAIGITIVLAAELAVLEPWFADVLRLRALGYATPAAPTELLAITVSFLLASLGMMALLLRVAFHRGWPNSFPVLLRQASSHGTGPSAPLRVIPGGAVSRSQAELISDGMRSTVQREEHFSGERTAFRQLGVPSGGRGGDSNASVAAGAAARFAPLGSSWRRTAIRVSAAGIRRDARR